MDPNVFLILVHKQDGLFQCAYHSNDLDSAIVSCKAASTFDNVIAASIVRVDLTEKMTAIYVVKSPAILNATVQQ